MILGLFGYNTAQHAGGGSNGVQYMTGFALPVECAD